MLGQVRLTKSEDQMMDIFWSADRPLTSVDIVNMKVKSTWGNGIVHNMIRSLLKKGLLKECGIERHKTQYARKLSPAMTKEEYIAEQLWPQVRGIRGFGDILFALFRKEEDKEEMITELEEIIQQFREKLAAENNLQN